MKKAALAVLLVLSMTISLVPTISVWAEGGNDHHEVMIGDLEGPDYVQPPKHYRTLNMMLAENGMAVPLGPPPVAVAGMRELLVILVELSDVAPDPAHTVAYFEDRFFDTEPPSVRDYYDEVSYGHFTYVPGAVLGWYSSTYDQNQWANLDKRPVVVEAIQNVDADFNFAPYDTNGDGIVANEELTIFIIVSGDQGGASHWWTANQVSTADGVDIEGEFNNTHEDRHIGSYCHELGHDLGLPDLYDTSDIITGGSEGIGNYGLMGGGSWTFSHMTAWSKIQLGWITPTIVTTSGHYDVRDAETNAEAYVLIDPTHSADEYFLVENRHPANSYYETVGAPVAPSGTLPDAGIIIYHVDESRVQDWISSGINNVNADETHKGVDVETAEHPTSHVIDADDLDAEVNRGDADDLWDVTEYDFNDISIPCNAVWYDGLPSGMAVSGFSPVGPTMRVHFSVNDPILKGLHWLRTPGRQASDGSWYGDPAVTSFAVLTMLNWGFDESDEIVSKGMDYVLSKINPDGSVHSVPSRYTYYTSIAVLPLAATRNADYHDELQRMRDWLIGSQWDESCFYGSVDTSHWYYGGFGYGSGSRPDLSNTQWALVGLKAADRELGLEATDTYNKAADYFLKRCQNSDGGSGYTPGSGSIHTMTAASVWSYGMCGRGTSEEALSGIRWLADRYSLTNNDGGGWWSEYYYKVTLAKALTMTHKVKLGGHDWFAELSEKLADEQYAAGNWPDTGMMGSEMSTCWAIMALQTRTLPPSGEFGMWATLESHCDLHMYDYLGRHTGVNYVTGTVEENIPGSSFKILDPDGNEVPYSGSTPDDGYKQVIELSGLMAGSYRIELVGTSDGPYHLTVAGLSDGAEVTTHTFEGTIGEGDRLATSVTATSMEGALTLLYEPLIALPTLGVDPAHLEVVGEPGTIAQAAFTISEIGGNETLHDVTIYCTDIVGIEGVINGADVTFDANDFDLAPGGSQVVNAFIPVPTDFEGPGVGSIIVESIDGGTRQITLTLLTTITAIIDFDPDVVNLRTRGGVVTAYIELPEGYDVGQIDVSSIRLNETVSALEWPYEVGDYNRNGIPDLMVKFDRRAVQAILDVGESVEITITGAVDGIPFMGTDTIRVINR